MQVARERVIKKTCGSHDEQRRREWIAPYRSLHNRSTIEDEQRPARGHIRQPLGEDSQREQLAEASTDQEKTYRKDCLHKDCNVRGVKAWMNLGEVGEKVAVARQRKRHA